MSIDYHLHPLGHKAGRYTKELLMPFLDEAQVHGLREVGFADHDDFVEGINMESILSLKTLYPDMDIKLGLEVSYRPVREEEIKRIAGMLPFDFLIGSIHDLKGWMFDHPDFRSGYSNWDISDLYGEYYSSLGQLVTSGLFDIVGHLDVIKVFGYRPQGELLPFAEQVLQSISRTDLIVEVNTAGLRKPCAEIYPAEELLVRCFELNIPVTLGSDAHTAGDVARDFAYAKELLYRTGYRRLKGVTKRQSYSVLL